MKNKKEIFIFITFLITAIATSIITVKRNPGYILIIKDLIN